MAVDVPNIVAFSLFVLLLLVGAGSTLARGERYRRAGMRLPVLWGRDRDLLLGLTLPFVLIMGARALGYSGGLSTQLWWTMLTAAPALYGVARYVYFELFVIERQRSRSMFRPETTIEQQDRVAGDRRRDEEAS